MPPASVLTVRWFGTTNFEFDYGDQVILLDTFYDRGPRARPIGFTVGPVFTMSAAGKAIMRAVQRRWCCAATSAEERD